METGYVCLACFKFLRAAYNVGHHHRRSFQNAFDATVGSDRSRAGNDPGKAEKQYDGGFGSETLHRFDQRHYFRLSE